MKKIQIILSLCFCTIASAKIIRIPADYVTIQEGIDASVDGDTVIVAPGNYSENLTVNTGIVLASEYLINPDTSIISGTIISGDSSSSGLLSVSVGETQVTITGFTFANPNKSFITDKVNITFVGYFSPGVRFTDSKIVNNDGGGLSGILLSDAPVIMKNISCTNNSTRYTNTYLNSTAIQCNNRIEMENVKIMNNTYNGINLNSSYRAELNNVTITGNNGYGILVGQAKSFFADNIKILNNGFEGIKVNDIPDSLSIKNSEIAYNNNGGLAAYFGQMKYFYLEGTSIHNNRAPYGGGLNLSGFSNDIFHMDEENRCSIYNNDAYVGSDINLSNTNSQPVNISIPLDTFTVANPSWFYACYQGYSDQTSLGSDPIQIDLQHSIKSTIASDLYVSPEGNDNNSGTTPASPLKTISQALCTVEVDSLHTHNIYLEEGIYSPSTNGERFPIFPRDYVSIIGSGSPDKTVINAEENDRVLYLSNSNAGYKDTTLYIDGRPARRLKLFAKNQSIQIKNLTITGAGKHFYKDEGLSGGGIFCDFGVNARIERCNIVNNNWLFGGGISIYRAKPIILNCTFFNNTFSSYSSVNLSDIYVQNQTDFDTTLVINSIYHEIRQNDVRVGAGIRLINSFLGADSMLIDAENGNYNLPEGSPLIDDGLTYYEHEGEVIVDFQPWEYAGDAPDIGAMEYGYIYSGINKNRIKTVNQFQLFQNYPNPFNAVTTLSFNLAAPAVTKIKIYNIRGQVVDIVKMNRLAAGYHYLKYNAVSLSSGIYFYKIQAGNNFNQTRKMILIK